MTPTEPRTNRVYFQLFSIAAPVSSLTGWTADVRLLR